MVANNKDIKVLCTINTKIYFLPIGECDNDLHKEEKRYMSKQQQRNQYKSKKY